MVKKTLFLIDGNSFCYRAYYAIKHLTNSRGQATNAIYGFVTMLNKIIKDNTPDMVAVAFDVKGPTFRHKKFEDYKVHRKPMPDDLVSQLPLIKKTLRAYNIAIFEREGYEADDVLATIATEAVRSNIDTFIVTGDKDALQLVGPHIKVYSPHKEGLVYDEEKVKERFKIGPNKVVDLMGLMGDATDNIPGVPGIGEKTATDLIAEFGSLENLFRNLDKVRSEAKKKILKENEGLASLSKELAVLDKEVPLEISFKDLKLKGPDAKKLVELFKEFEFKSLLKDIAPRDEFTSDYELISSAGEFDELVDDLKGAGEFAFDFETTHEDPMVAEPVGISFSIKKGKAYYVPVLTRPPAAKRKSPSGKQGEPLSADARGAKRFRADYVFEKLKPVFEDEKIKKIGQNIKYEYIVLWNLGIRLKGVEFDTMVASYILNPSKLNHNLDDISFEYLNHKMTTSIEELIGKGKNAITMDEVDIDKVCKYSCEDSDVTLRLKYILEKEIADKELKELFYVVEIPLIEVLSTMEINGVAIDRKYLRELSKEMDTKLESLTKRIYDLADCEFNINSHKQLAQILFEKLKLPVIKRTKTGFSTDEDVLRRLAPKHPLPETLLEYREFSKLKSTYVDALPDLINPRTDKIHASFNQTVTATGRLSSSEPNLQNIPIKTEEGRKTRKAFVPHAKDDVILSADYSQIELRILAHLSGDSNLIKAFKEGSDIHTYTASLVFGIGEEEVSKEMRGMAKTVNFGIVYGMSPYGLSQNLGIEVDKAKEFIDSYFDRYPDVKGYIEQMIEEARESGFATTLLGRRRYIPEIMSQDTRIKGFAERTAINTPIQGTAADLIKVAMISVHEEFAKRELASKMIIQVHDELVFNVPRKELKVVAGIVKDKMEGVMKLKVPIVSQIEAGENWIELERLE